MRAGDAYALALAVLFAVAAGLVGSFALSKRMLLASDVLSHLALPGLGIAMLIHINPLIGGATPPGLGTPLAWRLEGRPGPLRNRQVYPRLRWEHRLETRPTAPHYPAQRRLLAARWVRPTAVPRGRPPPPSRGHGRTPRIRSPALGRGPAATPPPPDPGPGPHPAPAPCTGWHAGSAVAGS